MVICYSSRGELTPQVSGVGGEGKRPSPTCRGVNPALLTRSTATKTCPVVFHQWRGHWVVRRWASPRCFPSGNRQMLVFWGSSPCGCHTGSPLRWPCPASHAPSVQLNAERWGPSVSCEPRCLPRITRLGTGPAQGPPSPWRRLVLSACPGRGTPDRWPDFVSGRVWPASLHQHSHQ